MKKPKFNLENYKLAKYSYLILFSWTLLFLIMGLSGSSVNINSIYPYILSFVSGLIIVVIINYAFNQILKWEKLNIWKKYLALGASYLITSIFVINVIIYACNPLKCDYFESCPLGSFALLILPSIALYFLVGLIILLLMKVMDIKWNK